MLILPTPGPKRQGTIVLVPPTGEPVTLAAAKMQLRIEADDTDKDVEIAALIAAAHRAVESRLGFPVLRQTNQTQSTGFPAGSEPIWLGGGAWPSVDQLRWIDADGVSRTMAPTDYVLDAVSQPAMVYPATTWPSVPLRPGAVAIDWTAGWVNADAVPADIGHAIKLMIGHWDQNREAVVVGTISSAVAETVDALLAPWRIAFVG